MFSYVLLSKFEQVEQPLQKHVREQTSESQSNDMS